MCYRGFIIVALYLIGVVALAGESSSPFIVLASDKITVGSCSPLKVIYKQDKDQTGPQTALFVFKYSDGVKLFTDGQCKKVKEGIGQIGKENSQTYYFKVDHPGKFTLSLIGLGKEKWSYSKNFQSAELDKVQASVKDRQAESMETYQKEKKLSDEEVTDNERIEGEIRDIAYNNLKLEVSYAPTYRTNQCAGPINIVIPNLDNIIRNKQFASYELQGGKNIKYYSDDKCNQETTSVKFEAGKAVASVYFKNSLAEKVNFLITRKSKRNAQGELVFEDAPVEYSKELEIQKFEKKLDRVYFYNNMLPKLSDQSLKDYYQEVYNNYENAKKDNLDYQKAILENLFILDSSK